MMRRCRPRRSLTSVAPTGRRHVRLVRHRSTNRRPYPIELTASVCGRRAVGIGAPRSQRGGDSIVAHSRGNGREDGGRDSESARCASSSCFRRSRPDRAVEPVDDPRCNVPRRYVDVLRSEFLAALSRAVVRPRRPRDRLGASRRSRKSFVAASRASTGRFVARLAGAESVNAVVEIAHDIRSPLSSILFLVDTIRRGQSGQVSPIQERQLGLVYGAALGLSTLSSDLIDAVRGERLVDGRPIPFSMTEVILERLRDRAADRRGEEPSAARDVSAGRRPNRISVGDQSRAAQSHVERAALHRRRLGVDRVHRAERVDASSSG